MGLLRRASGRKASSSRVSGPLGLGSRFGSEPGAGEMEAIGSRGASVPAPVGVRPHWDADDDAEGDAEGEAIGPSNGRLTLTTAGDRVRFRYVLPVTSDFVFETSAVGNARARARWEHGRWDASSVADLHVKATRGRNGSVAYVDVGSDLSRSHRITLEATNVTDRRGSSVSACMSTCLPLGPQCAPDFIDWGVSSDVHLNSRTSLFSRLSQDRLQGRGLVTQATYSLDGGRQVSALGALPFTVGISLKQYLAGEYDSVELKAIGDMRDYQIQIQANFGSRDVG